MRFARNCKTRHDVFNLWLAVAPIWRGVPGWNTWLAWLYLHRNAMGRLSLIPLSLASDFRGLERGRFVLVLSFAANARESPLFFLFGPVGWGDVIATTERTDPNRMTIVI